MLVCHIHDDVHLIAASLESTTAHSARAYWHIAYRKLEHTGTSHAANESILTHCTMTIDSTVILRKDACRQNRFCTKRVLAGR